MQLLGVEDVGRFRLYGTTIDDAVGEAFDKTAKLLGLAYPGGPSVEAAASRGNPKRYALPRPMHGRRGADFSFSGLKTAVRQIAREDQPEMADMAASFQAAVVDILIDRTRAAMAMFRADFPESSDPDFVLAGGVASNRAIREALTALGAREGFQTKIPPPRLCTDNAAMVAWTGVERGQRGMFDGLGHRTEGPLALGRAGRGESGRAQERLESVVIGLNHKQACHGPRMRATQVTMLFPFRKERRPSLASMCRTQLGGPHSRAMTLSLIAST